MSISKKPLGLDVEPNFYATDYQGDNCIVLIFADVNLRFYGRKLCLPSDT